MPTLLDLAVILEAAADTLRVEAKAQEALQKLVVQKEREAEAMQTRLGALEKDDDVLRLKLKQLQARIEQLEATAPTAPPDVDPPVIPPVDPTPGVAPGWNGYEGFGSITTGGTGLGVVNVTNLNDSGTGSLRAALSAGNRYVAFTVGGTIQLSSPLRVMGPNVTIDGLSAPAPGITLMGRPLQIGGASGAHNVIVTGIRSRNSIEDGITVLSGANRVVIDRCSVSGAADGQVDIVQEARDVTMQWCILGPGGSNFLQLTSYGSRRISCHKNLYYGAVDRCPFVSRHDGGTSLPSEIVADVRNNLVWRFTQNGTSIRDFGTANVVNNYYYGVPGTLGETDSRQIFRSEGGSAYTSGNYSKNGFNLNDNGDASVPYAADIVPVTTDAITAAHSIVATAGARKAGVFGLDTTDQAFIDNIVATLEPLPGGSSGGGGSVPGVAFEVDFADLGAGVADLVPTVGAISASFTRASAGTAVLATGLLRTDVATNVARVWHDPTTLEHMGVMIEGARTNLFLHSEDLSNAAWLKGGTTVTVNAIAAPDGATTADRLVETAVDSTHRVRQNFTKAASILQYSHSAFLKAQQVTSGRLFGRNAEGAKQAGCYIDLSNGDTTSGGPTNNTWTLDRRTSKAYASAWYRFEHTFTTDTDTALTTELRMTPSFGGATSYPGNTANGACMWGWQMEQAPFASSYIPTTSAAATRAKDVLTYPISSLLGATENTYFVNARTAPASGTQTYLSVDDGTANERVTIQRNASNELHVLVVDGGVTQADLNLGVVSHETSFRVAVRVKANDIAASLNGAAPVTDATATMPTLTTLRVGQDHAEANQAFAPVKKVLQYNTGLTNAELATLAA